MLPLNVKDNKHDVRSKESGCIKRKQITEELTAKQYSNSRDLDDTQNPPFALEVKKKIFIKRI